MFNIDICKWMQELEKQIKWSMKNVIRRCIIERDDQHIEDWLYNNSFNEQTFVVVESIKFNYDVPSVFNNHNGIDGLTKYLKKLRLYAKTIINFIHFDDIWSKGKENFNDDPKVPQSVSTNQKTDQEEGPTHVSQIEQKRLIMSQKS